MCEMQVDLFNYQDVIGGNLMLSVTLDGDPSTPRLAAEEVQDHCNLTF